MEQVREALTLALARLKSGAADDALAVLAGLPTLGVVESVRAEALMSLGRLDEAMLASERSLQLDPRSAGALNTRIRLLYERGDPAGALEVARRVCDSGFASFETWTLRGTFALELGHDQEARDCADVLDNTGAPSRSLNIDIAERAGDFENAWLILDTHGFDRDPELMIRAARVAPRVGQTDQVIDRARRWDFPADPRARSALHFALGDICDSIGRVDQAFDHYRSANEALPSRYSPERFEVEAYARYTTEQNRTPARRADSRPVFIVGMPRSGTTLLERMLASHPEIIGLGERDDIEAAIGVPSDEAADQITGQWTPGASRYVDKTPHNFLHLATIHRVFPDAQVIHIERDAIDTCWSCYTKDFHASHDYARTFLGLAHHYQFQARFTRECAEELGVKLARVRYEDLVRRPEAELRRLLAFLDLPFDPKCLEFRAGATTSASRHQVSEPLATGRIGRSARYSAFLPPLRRALEVA